MHMVETSFIKTSILCVDKCISVGFLLNGQSLIPYFILVSCFHGCCDIPSPVERITLGLWVSLFSCRCVYLYLHVDMLHFKRC